MAVAACSNEKKEEAVAVTCASLALSEEESPPDTPRVRTWGNNSIKQEGRASSRHTDLRWKVPWTWSPQQVWLHVCHAMKVFAELPIWKWTPRMKKHFFAVFLVFVSSVIPLAVLGVSTGGGYAPFAGVFQDKVIGCGGGFGGQPQNATVTGIEKLFALDSTFGKFSFSQVKTIDILWDLLVGRGLQLFASWAAYIVFCDALLRLIERHPASFVIFQRIALEGPGLLSLWTLTKELWCAKSRRTKALFCYVFWSTAYVLFVPIVLGAMTGYDSTAIAWVDLDGSNNIIPASILSTAWVIRGTKNETWPEAACADADLLTKYSSLSYSRRQNCDCQLANGTTLTPEEVGQPYYYGFGYEEHLDCNYNYANNTQTWEGYVYPFYDEKKTYSCNATVLVTVKDKTYDADQLNADTGYCYNSVGYNWTALSDSSRCLPDTANQTYKWGFSTLMSGLFVFFTAFWVWSMYILWLDAQCNSKLVREGYRMTPLRAAFAMAKAARRRMGLGEKALLRANTNHLERELYGKKGSEKTNMEYGLFAVDPEGGEEESCMSSGRSWPGSPCTPGTPRSELRLPMLPGNGSRSPVSSTSEFSVESSFQVITDEEVRARYERGVREARLSRKPLGRQATRYGDALFSQVSSDDHDNEINDGEDEKGGKKEDGESGKGKQKERNRLKKNKGER